MELRLDGKTALVTGASRGHRAGHRPGLRLGRRLGDDLVAQGRGPGRAAADIDAAKGDRAGPVDWRVANAGDPEQAEACVAATVERFGALDILVNNAATNPYYGPIIDIDTGRADKTVRVNQTGYLEWAQAAWRAGHVRARWRVLNMASIGGLSVEGGIGWYNVTKAAVIHLTSQLAGELGPGVRVNALGPRAGQDRVRPGPVGDRRGGHRPRLPLRRLGVVGGHRQRRACSCARMPPRGSPARPWSSTAAPCASPAAAVT